MNLYFATALVAATLIGLVALLAGYRFRVALGVGLVAWPLARLAVNVGASFGRLLEFTVLATIPESVLWESAGRSLLHNFAIPLAGLVLATGGARSALEAARVVPRFTWLRDALHGFALVPVVVGGYVLALAILVSGFAGRLVNGDESAAFAAMTPALVLVLSLVAGVAEEFLYRGVLLGILARKMPLVAASIVQAVLFGFAHAGYGTWAHVLGPLIFGLFMAWVALRLGLLPAVILHAAINVVFFSVEIVPRHGAAAAAIVATLALASLAALAAVRLHPFRELLRLPARAGA